MVVFNHPRLFVKFPQQKSIRNFKRIIHNKLVPFTRALIIFLQVIIL